MNDADLQLIDKDPRNPFAFSLDRCKGQLVAGYAKTTRASAWRSICRISTSCRRRAPGQTPR